MPRGVVFEINQGLPVAQDPVPSRAVEATATTSSPGTVHPQPLDTGMIWIDTRGVNLEEVILDRQGLAQAAARRMIFANMVIACFSAQQGHLGMIF